MGVRGWALWSGLIVASLVLCARPTVAGPEEDKAAAAEPERVWVKTQQNRRRQFRLAVASRRYVPVGGEGPMITLAGAVHIGDGDFYDKLQELVDSHDVVLFEGVGDHPDPNAGADDEDGHAALPVWRWDLGVAAMMGDPESTEVDEEPPADGIQKQLANTLGLTFQLEEMDSRRPNWRNSDMSLNEVRDKIAESGDNADMIFSMLDGSSVMAQMMGVMLNIIERFPGASVRMKVLMMETLASAEDLLMMGGGPLGENVMKVIIEDRNQVVIDDLKALLAERGDEIESVAVLYGAGHLQDMEERLIDQLGYTYDSTRWLTAMMVDLNAAGIDEGEMRMWRTMLRQQMALARAQMSRAADDDE